MKSLKIVAYLVSTVLFLSVLGLAFILYTSCFKWVPWFEPCGIQILGILTHVAPSLCFLNVLFLFAGMLLPISIQTRFLGLIAAGVLTLPIGLSEWLKDFGIRISFRAMLLLGVVASIALILWTLALAVRDVMTIRTDWKRDMPTRETQRLGQTKQAIALYVTFLFIVGVLLGFTRFKGNVLPWMIVAFTFIMLSFLTDIMRYFHFRRKIGRDKEQKSPNKGIEPIR